MKLASYKSTRPGLQGIANRLIRWRFKGPYSHSEIVFEPGDGVDALMPDGTCQPDADGALWCASSVAIERLPAWSKYRAGKQGGVRFKRIALDPVKWDVVSLSDNANRAARVFDLYEGSPYSWRHVTSMVAWFIELHQNKQTTCAQMCALAMGMPDPWRFDPCTLHAAAQYKGDV